MPIIKLTEVRRRLERAEAEVHALRVMVRSLAAALDAVPEKSLAELSLLEESKVLAGSPVGG